MATFWIFQFFLPTEKFVKVIFFSHAHQKFFYDI